MKHQLDFNTSYVTVQLLSNVLRILILLHFNTSYVTVQLYCSRYKIGLVWNFNTSYVTVQLDKGVYSYAYFGVFQYILCYGSTNQKKENQDPQQEFQYILCYGSTTASNGFRSSI